MIWLRWFAQPWALTLLLALPFLGVLLTWARWRRRAVLARLGTAYLVERLVRMSRGRRRWRTLSLTAGLAALILGMAGPRWGNGATPEALGGKDIVVVLDLSKSMLAEQPSRLERARRALRDFADMLEARGGHRVALVVFAAHAKLHFPLTNDYDHLRFVVESVDADLPPTELRAQTDEKIVSGTRVGAALALAAGAHDPQRAGRQDIILLSDGDDPAGDEEWLQGVQIAHQRYVPIHVVAIGDPREAHPIRQGGELLRHNGAVVQSKLNEKLLQEIARRTGGIYYPAHLSSLPLGRLMRATLETTREAPASDRAEGETRWVEAQPRHAWFVLASLILLGTTLLLGDGASMETGPRSRWNALPAAMIALALVSADTLPSVEDWVRQGNTAFARQQYDEALRLYRLAEEHTADPGLVAFNEGAALYRLGRFVEAAAHYERCLDDQLIPPRRLARASYDLGAALLQADAQDRRRLEQALAAFRRCLQTTTEEDLRADALHNLELAKWLWLKAKPPTDAEAGNTQQQADEKPPAHDPRGQGNPEASKKNGAGGMEAGPDKNGGVDQAQGNTQKKLAHGPLQVLPDSEQLTKLTPEDTAAHLDQFMERMRRLRRETWRQTVTAPHVKDW